MTLHSTKLNETIYFGIGKSTLGYILTATTPRGVCAIALDNEPDSLSLYLHQSFPHSRLNRDDSRLAPLLATLIQHIESPLQPLDLPLDISGTPFQQQVWQALQQIPTGSTASYTDIAKHIGSPKAVRAVAGACAANLLAIVIPCHRIVRADGSLSGYRWGVERKAELLRRERTSG